MAISALPSYIQCIDSTGVPITKSAKAGRKEYSETVALNYQISVPIDSYGSISGTAKHKPVIVTKALDASSSYFVKALVFGGILPKCTIMFYEINSSGDEVGYYSIELENVKVVDYQIDQKNVKDLVNERMPNMEIISLQYGMVTMKFLDGNIQVSAANK